MAAVIMALGIFLWYDLLDSQFCDKILELKKNRFMMSNPRGPASINLVMSQ